MKYLILVIVLAAAVVATLFFLPLKDGHPLVTLSGLQHSLSDAGVKVKVPGASAPAAGDQPPPGQVYRWRDAQGRLQFGTVPPPGVQAEPMGGGK